MEIILAAIDIDRTHNGFIAYLEKLARQLNAAVWLVHVAQPHPDVVEITPANAANWRSIAINDVHKPLLDYAEQMHAFGIPATPLILQGPVVECLLEIARELAVSMIVVNSHGHGPLYDVMVGSVAEGVTGGGYCPVLWVPSAWVDR